MAEKNDKPDTKPAPKSEDIPLHKKLAMGQNPKTGGEDKTPKTPA